MHNTRSLTTAGVCSTRRYDLIIIIIKSVCDYMKKQKKNKNRLKKNCGNISKTLEETNLQSYLKICTEDKRCFKRKGWSYYEKLMDK